MVQSEQNIIFPQSEVDNWISLRINCQLFHAMHLSQCIELLQCHKICLLKLQVLKKANPNKLNKEKIEWIQWFLYNSIRFSNCNSHVSDGATELISFEVCVAKHINASTKCCITYTKRHQHHKSQAICKFFT